MTTTREPLMLSDTAMVLLRQSIEVQEFISTLHEAFHAEMQRLSYPPRSMRYIQTWNSWRDSDAYRLRAQIYEELLRDIWHLWAYPDIPVSCHLDWHVVLDAELMTLAEKAFLDYGPVFWIAPRNAFLLMGTEFIPELQAAYTKALMLRTQTKTTL